MLTAEASMVVARSVEGEIAFCSGHIPYIGILHPEKVRVHKTDGQTVEVSVGSGFVEVSHDRIIVLTDRAEVAAEK